MYKKRILFEGFIYAIVAALFQLIPVFFSEVFILLTIFSTIPIYIISRKQIEVGITAYVIIGFMIFCCSQHESIIFMFLNGFLGIVLAYFDSQIKFKIINSTVCGFLLYGMVLFVFYVLAIPILPIKGFISLILVFIFIMLYVFFYYYFLRTVINKSFLLKKYTEAE